MYAVIETGGKQYRVEVGTELAVELLDAQPGEEITLDRILLVVDGDEAAVGRPVVEGATVAATVVRRDRADKVIVFKYKPKARTRVKKGHRQEQTILRITDVRLGDKSAAADVAAADGAKDAARKLAADAAAEQAAKDAAFAAAIADKVQAADAETADAETPDAETTDPETTDAETPRKTPRTRTKAAAADAAPAADVEAAPAAKRTPAPKKED